MAYYVNLFTTDTWRKIRENAKFEFSGQREGAPEATGAKVEPGSTATFDLQDVSGPAGARPVTALASIDPCFDANECQLVIG